MKVWFDLFNESKDNFCITFQELHDLEISDSFSKELPIDGMVDAKSDSDVSFNLRISGLTVERYPIQGISGKTTPPANTSHFSQQTTCEDRVIAVEDNSFVFDHSFYDLNGELPVLHFGIGVQVIQIEVFL